MVFVIWLESLQEIIYNHFFGTELIEYAKKYSLKINFILDLKKDQRVYINAYNSFMKAYNQSLSPNYVDEILSEYFNKNFKMDSMYLCMIIIQKAKKPYVNVYLKYLIN